MATTLSGRLSVDLQVTVTDTGTINTLTERLRTGTASFADIARTLDNGTGSNQANKVWYQQRTVTAGSNDDLNLTALTDRKGAALAFAKIKWIVLRIPSPATTVYLLLGGSGPANPFTAFLADPSDKAPVYDVFLSVNQIDGWTVDGTHKNLRINNPGVSSVTYDLILVGNS